MPQAWSNKDERQYEHIEEGQRKRGTPKERAKEIAARTVNKTRRQEDRTPNRTTEGTGNPRNRLENRSANELRNRARELNISGRSKMNKDDLVKAIRGKRR